MKVLAHLDPLVLERALLDGLADGAPGLRRHDALVIVPTSRLAGHVQRRLIERRKAWLGVEVVHFQALARRILEHAGRTAPRPLSPRLIEALVRRVLEREPRNAWTRYVRDRPGALAHLARSLKDLREAGLAPERVEAAGAELASLYAAFVEELERAGRAGWSDDAGLVESAIPHAAAFAADWERIRLHGAYELIGVHDRLLSEIDSATSVTVLLPYLPEAPASRYARRFLRGRAGSVEALPSLDGRLQLEALYDESARPQPDGGPRVSYRSTQGAAAEIRGAVRAALRAVRDGCPPAEIVIAARSLTPYEAALDEVFEREGLPWTGSLTRPLRNHPAIHDFALLVAILDDDFPRRPTAELLRSPRIRWERLAEPGGAPKGELADRWSRAAGIVGGLDEWSELLVESVGKSHGRAERSAEELAREDDLAARRVEEARRIEGVLRRLHERVEPGTARRWSDHADTLQSLVEELFDTTADPWREVEALLDEMRSLETLAGEAGAVSFAEMRRRLEAAIDRTETVPHRADNGGVRVLDMMQLRGLTCRHLFLVGMNSGVLPRPPRPDPVLTESLREALDTPRTPLPPKLSGLDEERLLLALTLGAATEGIELTWQRADEAGRGRTASLALRETARLSHGVPDLAACRETAAWHPSHPTLGLEWMLSTTGMLSSNEERMLTALRSVGQPPELDRWYPDLAPGLAMLRATESFETRDGGFDGRIGATTIAEHPVSVSALETLARCPLRFFFGRVLRVREFDEEAEPFELTPREIGLHTHDLLERVFARLRAEDAFELPLAERLRSATRALEESWGEAWHVLARRLDRRAPALWAAQEASWKGAIARFLAEDLERIEEQGWGAPEAERVVDQELAFGEERFLHLVGRVDRSFEGGARRVIGDYKTGKVEGLTNETRMLKADALQVPLYWMLADANARVEVLGVGPRYDPERVDRADRILTFDGLTPAQFKGFLETMRVLIGMVEQGVFPLNHDNTRCGYCPYELACRHQHPPTLEREEHAADRVDYADLSKKNMSRKHTLADVRGTR